MVCTHFFFLLDAFGSSQSSCILLSYTHSFRSRVSRLNHKCCAMGWKGMMSKFGRLTWSNGYFKIGPKFHTQILIAVSFFSFFTARHWTPSNQLTANYLLWKLMWWSCPAFKIAVVWFKPLRCDYPPTAFLTLSCLVWGSAFKIKHSSHC